MRLTTRVIVSIGIVATAFGQQAELTGKEITDKLQHRYEMIDDAVASFEQQVKFGYSNIEQTFSGTLTMRKPNMVRIESEHQTIVTNGVTVWAYSPANKQLIIDKYKENNNSISPEQFILTFPSTYYVVKLDDQKESGTLNVKLTPKDDRAFVKTVRLWVDAETWNVKRITILDINETETTYRIKDLRLNTNVKEQAFEFVAPAGTDIVDLRN